MRGPLLSITIPVYNEGKTLLEVLKRVGKLPINNYEIIIIDDASKDDSAAIITKYMKSHKNKDAHIKFIRHEKNQGKGAGIKSALKVAKGEYFVVQDADLEYDPEEIPSILEFAKSNRLNVVYGSRFLGKIENMPRMNYIANIFYNLLLRVLYGIKMTDMHTCYKMVKTSLIMDLKMSADGFDYATELISKLLTRNETIKEVPVSFHGRTKKEGKKINYLDGLECLYKLILFRLLRSDEIFHTTSSTAVRFLLVGALGFISNYTVLVICETVFDLQHVLAEIVAVILALHLTFILHDRWTYRTYVKKGDEKLSTVARYLVFLASNALGSLVTVVVFAALYPHMLRSVSLLIAAVAGLVWNYFVNKYVTWRPRIAS